MEMDVFGGSQSKSCSVLLIANRQLVGMLEDVRESEFVRVVHRTFHDL